MNIKKIGMTALAGSLVAMGANAAEMSVSGNAKVTYVTNSGGSDSMKDSLTGSPIGFDQFIGFNGSADNDIGTISLYTGMNVHGMAKSSSKLTIDMGDSGLIGFDGGTASFGLNAHKDMLPRAAGAEQAWDDTAGDAYTSGEATSGNIAYVNSFEGFDLQLVYAKNGGGNSADGNVGGLGTLTDGVGQGSVASATQTSAGGAYTFSQSFIEGDAIVTTAADVGDVLGYSNIVSTAPGTPSNLAGTIATSGAMALTAGGSGTSATGQFVTEITIR